jgi:hypothetical protein
LGYFLGLVAIVGLPVACQRVRESDKQVHPIATATSGSDVGAASTEAPAPPEQPANVLVWIETTPPGSAIVRVSDRFVLGWTPETIEFRRSSKPVSVRLELKGYLPELRDVPVAEDGTVSVALKADADKQSVVNSNVKARK